jgi:transcriptional regulator with XRE-family HTH domain
VTSLKKLVLSVREPQYVIAGACGIHPTTFSSYMSGKLRIKPLHLKKIADYFGVSQSEVLGENEESQVA